MRSLAGVAVKILGLYVALSRLPAVMLVVLPWTTHLSGANPLTASLVNALSGALQIGVGLALWWFAEGIAEILVKEESDSDDSARWSEVAFATLGLFFVADAAAHAVQVVGALLLLNYPPNATLMPPDNLSFVLREALPQLVRGAIGLWILLGARGLVRGVANLKNVGRDADTL